MGKLVSRKYAQALSEVIPDDKNMTLNQLLKNM